jgi:hypothetical protein
MDSAHSLSSGSRACPSGRTGAAAGQAGGCWGGHCSNQHPAAAAAAAAEGGGVPSQGVPPAQWVLLIRSCPPPRPPPPDPPWRHSSSSSSRHMQRPTSPAAAKAPDPAPTKDCRRGLSLGWVLGVCCRLLPWLLQLAAWLLVTACRRVWPPPTAALAGGIAVAALQDPEGCTQCEACGTGRVTGGDAGDPVTTEVFITCLLKVMPYVSIGNGQRQGGR